MMITHHETAASYYQEKGLEDALINKQPRRPSDKNYMRGYVEGINRKKEKTKMTRKRVEITLKFSADLDQIKGPWHQKEDWVQFVQDQLAYSTFPYNNKVEIQSVEEKEA